AEGYRVIEAETAARALIEARSHKPDAVLADLGLPDRDGQIVIRRIREFSPVPIIVLSARAMEADKVLALDGGADDYVTKPFSSTELLARVRAALRRSARSAEQQETLRLGRLSVNFGTREAVGPDGNVHFTPVEYRLLACLARGHGLIVTQDQIIREVWGPDRVTDTRGLRSYVKMLREKIEPDPALPRVLVTEPGVGYRLIVEQ
ncbi:MAG: two-component system, OmpR family, operon response regulator KdpE, partial [Pseudomonadota bacterium]|nr:two-component system, OmpR family, operon response regulator KdpE [Pseudomonadota bacterium]